MRAAVCIDTRDGPGRERLLGVYDYALQRNWNLFLVRRDDADAVKQVAEMRVDGAILFDRSRYFHRQLKKLGIVCIETSARNLELDDAAVFVDDAAVGRIAAQHLVETGLENFAYCGPSGSRAPSARRGASFCDYVKALGFPVDTFEETSAAGEAPLAPLTKWLRRLPKPVGILAFDDKVAERVLAACRWAGIRVPEDTAVVGVGNDELICELVEPQLTSVGIPIREIGRLAAELLDARTKGKQPVQQRPIPPTEVIVRASSERLRRPDSAVSHAIELVRARAHTPFGTDQIAAAIGMPRRTLERRFLASTGKTVHDFIIEARLRLAKQLLRRSRGSMGEVARQCGYSALTAFTRMFAERTGDHPAEYRRKMHRSD